MRGICLKFILGFYGGFYIFNIFYSGICLIAFNIRLTLEVARGRMKHKSLFYALKFLLDFICLDYIFPVLGHSGVL